MNNFDINEESWIVSDRYMEIGSNPTIMSFVYPALIKLDTAVNYVSAIKSSIFTEKQMYILYVQHDTVIKSFTLKEAKRILKLKQL